MKVPRAWTMIISVFFTTQSSAESTELYTRCSSAQDSLSLTSTWLAPSSFRSLPKCYLPDRCCLTILYQIAPVSPIMLYFMFLFIFQVLGSHMYWLPYWTRQFYAVMTIWYITSNGLLLTSIYPLSHPRQKSHNIRKFLWCWLSSSKTASGI